MADSFVAACVQLSSVRETEPNIVTASELIRQAAGAGAQLITLPEHCTMIEPIERRLVEQAVDETEHPGLSAFSDLARELSVWLLIGSLAVKAGEDKIANRSLLIDDRGRVAARYDKIHLYDAVPGPAEQYRESDAFAAGKEIVTAPTPWGTIGLSICYDLRFPYLYRSLAHAGALYLTIPSAFTKTTGESHWHVLVRARAIETGCYVLAPAQSGTHAEGRRTYGHSLIVDPWGEILVDASEGPGVITATVDPGRVNDARRRIPSLEHGRAL